MKRAAAAVTTILYAGLVLLWPAPCNRSTSGENLREAAAGQGLYKQAATKAQFGLIGFDFYETFEGKKRWHINSKSAELHRKENYAFLQEVAADFFSQTTGNVVHTLSDYGRSLLDKHVVELQGHVQVRSQRGYLFTMDHLNYHGESHEFTTPDLVQMKGPDVEKPTMFLNGTGLRGDINTEHFVLHKNVTAQRFMPQKNTWMRIYSGSGEFFTNEQRSVFRGTVKSFLPSLEIQSDFQELSVGEAESMFAKGSVVLKSRDRIGHADQAFIQMTDNRVILEGRARIDSKNNQIRGRRMIIHTDDDRIEVDEAEGRVQQ